MQAGFLINWEKSSLFPSTSFAFLGMIWNSVEGLLALPEDKLVRLRSQASSLLQQAALTCRQVMILTGLVAAFHRAVPLLRLKGRYIQLSLNSIYSSEADLHRRVVLLPEARRDLQ
jgi:Mlc titration factor MtfA (ptsG expression regulator)